MLPALVLLTACATKAPEVTPVLEVDPLAAVPTVSTPRDWSPVVPETFELSNGIPVWIVEQPELPLVSLQIVVDGGARTDGELPGLANLTDAMLLHGAGERDATSFAAETERLALDLDVGTGSRTSVVSLDAHADHFAAGLDLLADIILRPTFPAEELERLRELHQGELTQLQDSPRSMAGVHTRRLWWGEGHPMAHPALGTAEGLAAIQRGELVANWKARYRPSRAGIVVTGAVEQESLKAALEERLGGWQGASKPEPVIAPAAAPAALHLFHEPGASQSVFVVTLPGWSAEDPQLVPAHLGTIVLGGTFTSRLNRLLREEKGYTYGARASLDSGPGYGMLQASTAVQADVTGPAMRDLLDTLAAYPAGITEDERLKAAGAWRTSVIEAMGSRSSIAGTYADEYTDGYAPGDLAARLDQALGTDVDTINAAIAGLDLSAALVVVVGDADVVAAPLAEAVPGEWQVHR